MRSERDAHSEMGKLIELRKWKDMNKLDPGIGQGRPNHNPQRDRDIVAMVAWLALSFTLVFVAAVVVIECIKWLAK